MPADRARLARRLEALAVGHGRRTAAGTEVGLKLSQSELANMLGVRREGVTAAAVAERGGAMAAGIRPGDVLVAMGAGDIDEMAHALHDGFARESHR